MGRGLILPLFFRVEQRAVLLIGGEFAGDAGEVTIGIHFPHRIRIPPQAGFEAAFHAFVGNARVAEELRAFAPGLGAGNGHVKNVAFLLSARVGGLGGEGFPFARLPAPARQQIIRFRFVELLIIGLEFDAFAENGFHLVSGPALSHGHHDQRAINLRVLARHFLGRFEILPRALQSLAEQAPALFCDGLRITAAARFPRVGNVGIAQRNERRGRFRARLGPTLQLAEKVLPGAVLGAAAGAIQIAINGGKLRVTVVETEFLLSQFAGELFQFIELLVPQQVEHLLPGRSFRGARRQDENTGATQRGQSEKAFHPCFHRKSQTS